MCPTRLAPRLTDLPIGCVAKRAYKAGGLTIACQVRYGTTAFRQPLFLFPFLFFLLIFEGESVTQDGIAGHTTTEEHGEPTTNLGNTTIPVEDDGFYYEIVTRFWYPNLTRNFKLEVATGRMDHN